MEQGRVARAEGERHERVRLVAGGADRVEAELAALEPAGRVVDRAALDLRPPGRLGLERHRALLGAGREAPAGRRRGAARAGRGRRPSGADGSGSSAVVNHRSGDVWVSRADDPERGSVRYRVVARAAAPAARPALSFPQAAVPQSGTATRVPPAFGGPPCRRPADAGRKPVLSVSALVYPRR